MNLYSAFSPGFKSALYKDQLIQIRMKKIKYYVQYKLRKTTLKISKKVTQRTIKK